MEQIQQMSEQEEQAIKTIHSSLLHQMVDATTTLKILRSRKEPLPNYLAYKSACESMNQPEIVPPEEAYNFALNLINSGQTSRIEPYIEDILLQSGNIVEAELLATFKTTRLYLYKDLLIVTCPTHIELMQDNIKGIFPGFSFIHHPKTV